MKSVPHRCEPCREQGTYYGQLVFGRASPPKCKVHGKPITPAPFPPRYKPWVWSPSEDDDEEAQR